MKLNLTEKELVLSALYREMKMYEKMIQEELKTADILFALLERAEAAMHYKSASDSRGKMKAIESLVDKIRIAEK